MGLYRVAVHYGTDIGYVEYDAEKKAVRVELPNELKKQAVEGFLSTKHTIAVPRESLMDFEPVRIEPSASLDDFKTAMTRLWENTQVHVDWSRPV